MTKSNPDLAAMLEVLHMTRQEIMGSAANDADKRNLVMAWAAACLEESRTVLSAMDPDMPSRIFAEAADEAKRP